MTFSRDEVITISLCRVTLIAKEFSINNFREKLQTEQWAIYKWWVSLLHNLYAIPFLCLDFYENVYSHKKKKKGIFNLEKSMFSSHKKKDRKGSIGTENYS